MPHTQLCLCIIGHPVCYTSQVPDVKVTYNDLLFALFLDANLKTDLGFCIFLLRDTHMASLLALN